MAKKCLPVLALLLLLCLSCACAQTQVERLEGEAWFPSEKDWTYHFTYAYPRVLGEDYAAAAVSDAYAMVLDEQLNLMLPMISRAEDMRFDGKNEIAHDFSVTCNNGRFLSIVQYRTQQMGEETRLAMEALVFDMAGEYLGETLTLRGVVMVGDSSVQLGEALYPVLYKEFCALQEKGVMRSDIDEETFYLEFEPTRDFYADEDGNIVFFFPPLLLATPSFDVPTFPYTAEELSALL